MNTRIKMKTKYLNEYAILVKDQYLNGVTALTLRDVETGEPLATATVNLPDAIPAPGNIFVKNYSENEGMVQGLREARVIGKPIRWLDAGYVKDGVAEAELLV